jgi:hypothetical protein
MERNIQIENNCLNGATIQVQIILEILLYDSRYVSSYEIRSAREREKGLHSPPPTPHRDDEIQIEYPSFACQWRLFELEVWGGHLKSGHDSATSATTTGRIAAGRCRPMRTTGCQALPARAGDPPPPHPAAAADRKRCPRPRLPHTNHLFFQRFRSFFQNSHNCFQNSKIRHVFQNSSNFFLELSFQF